MMSQPRWIESLLVPLIILGGLLPMILNWWFWGRVPTLAPQDAIEILNTPDEEAVLVDVRDTGKFETRHLEVAQNWPLEQILAISSPSQVPMQLQDKTLLLICEAGFSSAEATRKLQSFGVSKVYNVRGGMQEWISVWEAPCTMPLCRFRPSSGDQGLSFRATPIFEQWAGVIAGFGFKPVYMLSSLVLVWILRHRNSPDLVALRWALIFFFVGEGCCAVYTLNYLFFRRGSDFFEYLHGYGMVLAFAFTGYAIIEGLDTRGVKLSNPGKKCAALDLCGPCIKYEDAPCGARRLFLLLVPLLIILAAIPLFATPSTVSYNTFVTGTFYNYSHLVIHQIFETRYCPSLAIGLFSISFLVLWRKKDRPVTPMAKFLFAAGFGPFGFSMFRLLFTSVYQNNLVWFDFWEELTELLYVATIGCVLWIFRRRLFQEDVREISATI
ncbi:MAG: rhodanese-like domain-containing protein [Deltaproteobacteria bacterium]|nr:MAG: rhodanese-like domain-containing protein [Deltaproteobacteria bacterium]